MLKTLCKHTIYNYFTIFTANYVNALLFYIFVLYLYFVLLEGHAELLKMLVR